MMNPTKHIIILILCLAFYGNVHATEYFVRTDGCNSNSGKVNSIEGAWQTLEYALSKIRPGDHVMVNEGHYTVGELRLENIKGNPKKVTTISAVNRWGAVLTQKSKPEDDTAILTVANSSYVVIDGFELYDAVDTGVGITVREGSHHVTVRNCYVHDCGCNGISSRESDYLTIEKNVVRGNARRNEWNCSGISIWHAIEHDQKPGYHIVIQQNVAFENECDLPFRPLGYDNPTDGNGIIVDDFRNTQGGGQKGGYKAAVLVSNNLSFNNGGRGINVFESDNVDVVNNTTYHNLRVISKYADFPGEVTISNSTGSRVYNNLVVKNPGLPTKALRCYDNDSINTKVYNNIIIGEKDFCGQTLFDIDNQNRRHSDQGYPNLRKPKLTPGFSAISDFRLFFEPMYISPALDAGAQMDAPAEDIDGLHRPVNGSIDIGCYEVIKGN